VRARRAAALLGLGLVASLLLGGCWDQVEIEELAFALAVGLDQGTGGNLAVTLQVAVPPPQGSGAASGGGPGASARPLVAWC
jgi:spore germination protein KC